MRYQMTDMHSTSWKIYSNAVVLSVLSSRLSHFHLPLWVWALPPIIHVLGAHPAAVAGKSMAGIVSRGLYLTDINLGRKLQGTVVSISADTLRIFFGIYFELDMFTQCYAYLLAYKISRTMNYSYCMKFTLPYPFEQLYANIVVKSSEIP